MPPPQTIPEDWEKGFIRNSAHWFQTEDQARLAWRRAADGAVEPILAFLSIADANEAFLALEDDLRRVGDLVAEGGPCRG